MSDDVTTASLTLTRVPHNSDRVRCRMQQLATKCNKLVNLSRRGIVDYMVGQSDPFGCQHNPDETSRHGLASLRLLLIFKRNKQIELAKVRCHLQLREGWLPRRVATIFSSGLPKFGWGVTVHKALIKAPTCSRSWIRVRWTSNPKGAVCSTREQNDHVWYCERWLDGAVQKK